jgi:hypothetical protein
MTVPVLLAVVEVPHEDRVRCAAEGCGHSVFRRIHLVRIGGSTQVYGSDCFARLFGSTPAGQAGPRYGNALGRALTPEERALLAENTERLIEQFEQEHQAEIAAAERRRALLEARQAAQAAAPLQTGSHPLLPPAVPPKPPPTPPQRAPAPVPTAAQRAEAEARARLVLGQLYPGANLDLPGFKGLLRLEADRILRSASP